MCISLYYRVKLDPLLRRDLSEDPIKCLLCYIVSVLWLMGMLLVFIPVGFLCGSLLRLSRLLFHWFRCSKLACEWPSEMITSKMFTFGPVEVIFLPFMHAFVKGKSFFLNKLDCYSLMVTTSVELMSIWLYSGFIL